MGMFRIKIFPNSRYITWIKNHVLFQLGSKAGCKIKKFYNSWEELTQCKKLIAINHNGILAPNNKNFHNIKTKSARYFKKCYTWMAAIPTKNCCYSKKITVSLQFGPTPIQNISLHLYPKFWEKRLEEKKRIEIYTKFIINSRL